MFIRLLYNFYLIFNVLNPKNLKDDPLPFNNKKKQAEKLKSRKMKEG